MRTSTRSASTDSALWSGSQGTVRVGRTGAASAAADHGAHRTPEGRRRLRTQCVATVRGTRCFSPPRSSSSAFRTMRPMRFLGSIARESSELPAKALTASIDAPLSEGGGTRRQRYLLVSWRERLRVRQPPWEVQRPPAVPDRAATAELSRPPDARAQRERAGPTGWMRVSRAAVPTTRRPLSRSTGLEDSPPTTRRAGGSASASPPDGSPSLGERANWPIEHSRASAGTR
jgi:hypothetical protein